MTNMSDRRFRNTFTDLWDCWEHLHDELSVAETEAKRRLIALCLQIVEHCEGDYTDK